MKQEKDTKKIIFLIVIAFVMAACSTGTAAGPEKSLDSVGAAIKEEPADSAVKKPLVVYYSRTNNCRMLATALGSQLNAEVEEMPSEKDRGIFTIIGEQYFGGDDKQKPFEKNLPDYSPIIVVAPIYLMKFSAPGRFFIKEVIPEGSEVYVITMTGGPPPESAHKKIAKMATDSGLVVLGVHGFQAGKTQEEFDSEIKEFLKETPLIQALPESIEKEADASNEAIDTPDEKPAAEEQE
jgi:flavodoxin